MCFVVGYVVCMLICFKVCILDVQFLIKHISPPPQGLQRLAVVAAAVRWSQACTDEHAQGRVGAPTIFVPPNVAVQWQPDGVTIYTKKWFLGAGFLGAPTICLT